MNKNAYICIGGNFFVNSKLYGSFLCTLHANGETVSHRVFSNRNYAHSRAASASEMGGEMEEQKVENHLNPN